MEFSEPVVKSHPEGVRLPVEGVLSVCIAAVCLPMATSSNKIKELWEKILRGFLVHLTGRVINDPLLLILLLLRI